MTQVGDVFIVDRFENAPGYKIHSEWGKENGSSEEEELDAALGVSSLKHVLPTLIYRSRCVACPSSQTY